MTTEYRLSLLGARAITVATNDRDLRTLGREAEVARMVLLERMGRGVDVTADRAEFRERARVFTSRAWEMVEVYGLAVGEAV